MKHFLLLATLLFLSPAWSQQMDFLFKGQIENQDLGKKEGGVIVSIVQGGKTISSATSASNGKYTLKGAADYSQPFQVVFTKAGMVTKKVGFNLANLNEEDVPAGLEYRPVESLDMSLFKERDNVDFSFLETQPVAVFTWNDRRLAATPDLVAAKKISQKIEKLLIDAEKNKAENEANYQAAIQAANSSYDSQSYPEALAKYEEALGYKPSDKYASDRVVELDALIKAQKDQELAEGQARQEYDNLISAADNLKKQGELEKAVSKYKEAIAKKSDEQYPKDQVTALTAQIAAKKKETENQDKYDAAIKLGNTFMKQNSVRAAKGKYEEALKLKPSEQYPKDKLAEIEKMMSALEEKEALKKQYDAAVAAADVLYDSEDFENAKAKYQEALAIESASTYVKGRIGLCDEAMNAEKAETDRLAKIETLLKEGATSMTSKNYEEAKGKFSEVLGLDAENTIAKQKLAEIDKLVEAESNAAAQKELQDKIAALLEEGNTLFGKDELATARSKFEEVITLDAGNGQAKAKIIEIDAKILAAEKLSQEEEAFANLVTEGDNANSSGDLTTALQKYQEANGIKSTQEVETKIAAVQSKIEEEKNLADKNAKYNGLISEATALLDAKNLTASKAKFEEAAAIDPSQTLPSEKIAEIDRLVADEQAADAKEKEYNDLITQAQSAFDGGDLSTAKSTYEEAGKIDASKDLPKQRIQEIDALLKDQEDAAAKEEQISSLLKNGNDLLSNSDLDGAKSKFQEVLGLDPSNGEATTKIDEINTQLASLKSENEKEEAFKELVDAGDDLVKSKDLQSAKQKYQEALTLKPGESTVSDKLAAVEASIIEEGALADQQKQYDDIISRAGTAESTGDLANAIVEYKKAAVLKPSETLPKSKITELEAKIAGDVAAQEAINKSYSDAIAKAKGEEQSGNIEAAIASYKEALIIKPSEALPKSKVTELEAKIAGDVAAQDAINKSYSDAIAKAKGEEQSGNLEAAIASYKEASSIKPSEALPKSKVTELEARIAGDVAAQDAINKSYSDAIAKAKGEEQSGNIEAAIASYKEAAIIKPSETLPKSKIAELEGQSQQADALNEAIEKRYADAIYAAESEEGAGNLQAAITQYKKAQAAKPSETLPKTKITELESKIQASISEEADVNARYNELMGRGKELMRQGNYLKAIEEFNNALAIKPSEKEPVDLAAEAKRKEEELGEGEAQYRKILSVAEKKIESGDFAKAEELIGRAKTLKPGDTKQQELLDRIAVLKEQQNKYDAAMSKGEELAQANQYNDAITEFRKARQIKAIETLPSERITEMERLIKEAASGNQKEQLYADFMKKGNTTFGASRYKEALSSYQSALSVKPGDTDAQNKINEVQQILDDLANKTAAERALKEKFDKLILAADKLFSAGQYVPGAKQIYDQALELLPTSKYAKTQSDECVKREKNISKDTARKEYRKLLKVADKKFGKEDYSKAKELYTRAVKFRPSDQYPKAKLAEIESILNPVVAESVELEDLGDPFDGSILDGGSLLNKDAQTRESRKNLKIQRKQNRIKNSERDMMAQKTTERQEVINKIYEVQRLANQETEDLDDGRQEIIDALRKSEDERDEVARENESFEKSENLAAQSRLNTIQKEVAIDYGVDEQVYQDNSETLKSYSEALEDDMTTRSKDYMALHHAEDQRLSKIEIAVEEDIRSDYVEHLDLEKEVVKIVDRAQDKQNDLTADQYQGALDQKDVVDGVIENVASKTKEDAKAAGLNNEEVKSIQSDVVVESAAQSQKETAHIYKTDLEIADVKERVISDNQGSEKIRDNARETIAEIKDKREESQYIAYNQEMEKYLINKAILTEEEKKRKDVKDKEVKAQGEKIAYVEKMDEKATASTSQAEMKDSDEHQNAKKSISNVTLSIGETTAKESVKHTEKVQTLSDVSKAIEQQEHNTAVSQKDKAYEAQTVLNNIDDKPKPKKKIANALGEEYPEGVSQESFTRKDENGLATAVITRRVVVIDGHADVYTRTQTINGITYSKNGKPSLSHVWSKETQGPDLVRHY